MTCTLLKEPDPPRRRPDWSVLDLDGIDTVARNAARKVAAQYATTTEYDDLYQEARIILANHPDTVHSYGLHLGLLHHWLWCDLTNLANSWTRKRGREISYEALRKGLQ